MNSRTIFKISIIILILSLAAGFIFWWPKFQNFLLLKNELETKEKAVAQKKDYFLKLKQISDRLENYSSELAKIDPALSTDPDTNIPILIRFMMNIASENGLLLGNLTLSPDAVSDGTGEIKNLSFNIEATGSYVAFKNFLSNLYKNSRIFEIDSISFSSPDEKTKPFSFNLTIRTHFYSPKKATTKNEINLNTSIIPE